MPELFTADDFSSSTVGPTNGPFTAEDFSSGGTPDASQAGTTIFSPEDFLPDAPAAQDNTRAARKIDLRLQKRALESEPPAPVGLGSLKGLAADAVTGFGRSVVASGLKGLAIAAENLGPFGPEDFEGHAPQLQARATEQLATEQDPLAKRNQVKLTPPYQTGKEAEDVYNDLYQRYVPEAERETVAHQLVGDVVGLAPAMTGPAAPFVFALNSAGEHFDADYDRLIDEGKKPAEAAQAAADRSLASGLKEFALWEFGPQSFRKFLGDKIAAKAGAKGAAAWLQNRGAAAAEMGTVSAGSKAGENVIEGDPALQGTGTAFIAGAGLGAAMPGHGTEETATEPPDTDQNNSIPPKAPVTPPQPVKPPVTRDLVAELKAAMEKNQVAPEAETQPAAAEPDPALVQAVAEKVKQDLVDRAVSSSAASNEEAKRDMADFSAASEEDYQQGEATAREHGSASISLLQRRNRWPYAKATAVMAELERRGVVGPARPGEAREVLPLAEKSAASSEPKGEQPFTAEDFAGKENAPSPSTERAPKLTTVDASEQLAAPDHVDAGESQRQSAPAENEPETNLSGPAEEVKGEAAKNVYRGQRARVRFDRETEMNGPDILSWLADYTPILSKSKAKQRWRPYEKNKSLWDDAPILQSPHHNIIYGRDGGLPPDQVAAMASDAGQIPPGGYVGDLWQAIDEASRKRAKVYETQRREQRIIHQEEQQHVAWEKATQAKRGNNYKVTSDDLKVGDVLDVGGEHVEVTEINPDTDEVTVKDGTKFGHQVLPSGKSFWVEKLEEPNQTTVLREEPPAYGSVDSSRRGGESTFRDAQQPQIEGTEVSGREQHNGAGGRLDIDPREQPRENARPAGEPGALQETSAGAETASDKILGHATPRREDGGIDFSKLSDTEIDRLFDYEAERDAEAEKLRKIGNRSPIKYPPHSVFTRRVALLERLKAVGADSPEGTRIQTKLAALSNEERRLEARPEVDPRESQSAFEQLLDRAIDATRPGTKWTGQTSMGLAKLPVWLTQELAHGALRVIRAVYRGGKHLKAAVDAGVEWLADQKLEGFDREEARAALTDIAQNAEPMVSRPLPGNERTLPAIGDKVEFQLGNQTIEGKVVRHVDNPVPGAPEPKVPVVRTSRGDEMAAPEYFDSGKIVETKTAKAATGPVTDETNQAVSATDRPETETERNPGSSRTWQDVQNEVLAGDQELKDLQVAGRDLKGLAKAENRQQQNIAAARIRTLRDELKAHPGLVADLLLENERITTALKAEGLTPEQQQGLEQEREFIQGKLQKLNPRQVSAVYAKLQDEGKIAKPEQKPIEARSIEDLTKYLEDHKIDSPKLSLLQRLNLAQSLVDRWHGYKDAAKAASAQLAGLWKAGVEAMFHQPEMTGFRDLVKEWHAYDTRTGLDVKTLQEAIETKVPIPLRQMAISIWMDAGGDESLIRHWSNDVKERFAPVFREALKLTEDEKGVARQAKADFERKLDDLISIGVLDKGRAEYGVPQIWEIAPEADPAVRAEGNKGSSTNAALKLDPRDPFFTKPRSAPNYYEGIQRGGVPKDLRIGKLVAAYEMDMHKAISSRWVIMSLKHGVEDDGKPSVVLAGNLRQASEDGDAILVDSRMPDISATSKDNRPYQTINHFALKGWKQVMTFKDGTKVLVNGDMMVHPDLYERLNNELESSELRKGTFGKVVKSVASANRFLKESKLAFASFHMVTIANHVASHFVNPFTGGFKIDLRDPDQALLVRQGLELGMGDARQAFEEGNASHGGLFRHIPGLGDFSVKLSDWMFQDWIPAAVMKSGLTFLKRNRERFAGKYSDERIAEISAQSASLVGGFQNKRVQGARNNFWSQLGANKTLMDLSSLVMLAPRFFEARARIVGRAFRPEGVEERRMLAFQTLVPYAACRILNMLTDDDAHWEARAAFGVVYHGRLYSIRTLVGDAWHLVTDPGSFASGRMAGLVRVPFEALTERDMRTGARLDPIIPSNYKGIRSAELLVQGFAKWLSPIGSEAYLPGAAGREQTKGASALSALGIGSSKYTPAMQVNEWAKNYNRKGDASARTFQRHQDGEAHSESDYRKLDALLDAGKLDQARAEYSALQKDGHKPEAISERYNQVSRPFTGRLDREQAFRAALNAAQKQIYDRAIAERNARRQAFQSMAAMRN